jgi:hypothetical protein
MNSLEKKISTIEGERKLIILTFFILRLDSDSNIPGEINSKPSQAQADAI